MLEPVEIGPECTDDCRLPIRTTEVPMQLLHLTDLHYTTDQPFQKALIEALLNDLKYRVADGFTPKFIVFSGDIVHNPDDTGI